MTGNDWKTEGSSIILLLPRGRWSKELWKALKVCLPAPIAKTIPKVWSCSPAPSDLRLRREYKCRQIQHHDLSFHHVPMMVPQPVLVLRISPCLREYGRELVNTEAIKIIMMQRVMTLVLQCKSHPKHCVTLGICHFLVLWSEGNKLELDNV